MGENGDLSRRGFLAVALFGFSGKADKRASWNDFVAAYKQTHEDLLETQKYLKKEGPHELSVDMIFWTEKANVSMRRMEKAWKKFRETVI